MNRLLQMVILGFCKGSFLAESLPNTYVTTAKQQIWHSFPVKLKGLFICSYHFKILHEVSDTFSQVKPPTIFKVCFFLSPPWVSLMSYILQTKSFSFAFRTHNNFATTYLPSFTAILHIPAYDTAHLIFSPNAVHPRPFHKSMSECLLFPSTLNSYSPPSHHQGSFTFLSLRL